LENKAHRSDRKWRSALSPELPVPLSRLAAPLAWGGNLWLLLVGWPMAAQGAVAPGLAAAAATPLIAGAALASVGLVGLASACFLVAFPLGIAGAFALDGQASVPPSVAAVTVMAASMWVYGAAVSRGLRLPVMESGNMVRIESLAARARSPRYQAAQPARQRASRVRSLGVALMVVGASAIAIVAPGLGDESHLYRLFGDDPRHAMVLIAMVAVAIGVGVVSAFTTALVRPPTAEDRRPFSPMRAALGLIIALLGAATYYVLTSS